MTKLDMYWASNKDWITYNDDDEPVVRETAPEQAKESYRYYLRQKEDAGKRGAL